MDKSKIIIPELIESAEKFKSIFERLKKEYPKEMGMMFKDHD